ncbi:MAG: zf-TFIIB domain-containing protein [Nitrospinae bacterium]|nr:zf-TFIIB domain-containing protein [Nitrospinota bacterium]
MKLIVKCDSCSRQYNATGHKPGSRFRCRCGAVQTIPTPKESFDAQVIRCSSCGAPRQGESTSCQFCGSDFTLHEKDMHTVCPGCMTRISDKAQYCHYCGERIIVEENAGEQSDIHCPACGKEKLLHIRKITGKPFTFMECDVCNGMWLGHEVFQELRKESAQGVSIAIEPAKKGSAHYEEGFKKQSGELYRRCPHCNLYMARRNFEKKSGIIVDICSDHGIWFDNDELNRLLLWVKKGGLIKAQEANLRDKNRLAKETKKGSSDFVMTSGSDYFDSHDTSLSFSIGAIVGGIFTGIGDAISDGFDADGGGGGD